MLQRFWTGGKIWGAVRAVPLFVLSNLCCLMEGHLHFKLLISHAFIASTSEFFPDNYICIGVTSSEEVCFSEHNVLKNVCIWVYNSAIYPSVSPCPDLFKTHWCSFSSAKGRLHWRHQPLAVTEAVELEISSVDDAKCCCRCGVQKWGRSFFHSSRLGFYAVCRKELWLLWTVNEFWIKISSHCYRSHKSYM